MLFAALFFYKVHLRTWYVIYVYNGNVKFCEQICIIFYDYTCKLKHAYCNAATFLKNFSVF